MLHRRGRTNAETAPGTSERRFCVLLLLGRRLLLESPQQSDASQDHRARGKERQRAGLRHRHRGVRIPGIDEEDGEGHHRDQQPGAFSHWREPPCASYLSRVRVTFSDLCENSNNRAPFQRSVKLAICALGPGVPSGTWKIPRQMRSVLRSLLVREFVGRAVTSPSSTKAGRLSPVRPPLSCRAARLGLRRSGDALPTGATSSGTPPRRGPPGSCRVAALPPPRERVPACPDGCHQKQSSSTRRPRSSY